MSTIQPSEAIPSRREVWVRMLIYPRHTLPTALAPVLVAAALALHDGVLSPAPAAAALLAGWLLQLGGVIADNYSNLRRHADDREHPLLVRALEAEVVSLDLLARATAACYAAALLPGAYLAWIGGVPVLVAGLAGMAGGLAYSADPLRLGDRGLGDPLFFLFFGPVSVVGAYYVQAAAGGPAFPVSPPPGSLPLEAVVASLAMGGLVTNILLIDNIRDLPFDREKGERTLAVVIGRRWTEVELGGLTVLAYLVPFWFAAREAHDAWMLLPLLTVPEAVGLARRVIAAEQFQDLVPLTPRAGRLAVAWAALFAVGAAL